MYEEERKTTKFPIIKYVVKVLLVVLIIILLLLLLPIKKLDSEYDQTFANNINAMKDAGLQYFTVERLPKNREENVRITLQEMINKHLLLEFGDKDGKSCDTNNSYIEVSMGDTEYEMKIYLSCDDKQDYVIVPMGCYDTCFDCEEKEETTKTQTVRYKYQFKKTITKNMVVGYEECKNGYTKDGNKCIKTLTDVETAQATENKTYTCSSYYDNAGTYKTKTTCTKKITATKTETAQATENKTYTCSSNYDNKGTYNSPTTCTKKVTTTKTETAQATENKTYTCSSYYDNAGTYKTKTTCTKKVQDGYTSWVWTDTEKTTSTKSTYTNTLKKRTYWKTQTVYDCDECFSGTTYNYYKIWTREAKYTQETAQATENKTYTCSSNYDNKGTYNSPTTCKKEITTTDSYKANPKYETTTYTEYKWSTKKKLSGWTYTGVSKKY